MNEENKEVLEKEVQEKQEPEVNTEVETNVEEVKDNEPEKDSEEYYDDINYQKKEDVEKVKEKTRNVFREIFDWVICFVIAYVIYLLINYFLISAPGVRQESMYPTVMNGERVLVVRPWMAGKLEYGEIVTFEAPIDNKYYLDSAEAFPTAQYETYTGLTLFLYNFMDVNKTTYIKRVIGLPGDHIQIKDGNVYRNDVLLTEPYLREPVTDHQEIEYSDVIVPEDTVYVMGDNRGSSMDSRTFGCIPFDRVSGEVVCRLWPLNKLGAIDK